MGYQDHVTYNGTRYDFRDTGAREEIVASNRTIGKNSIAPLIYGQADNGMYAKIDTVNRTMTFPNDTIVINNTNVGSAFIILSGALLTCDFSSVASSAIRVYFDPTTSTWQPRTYAQTEPSMILIATIRNIDSMHNSVNMYGPFTVNGKLFGLNIEQFISDMLTPNYIVKGINHRGACLVAPENTLPAYRMSKKLGFNYVETDVAFTSDNVAVLLHDETVDRTSDGTGNIADLTYDYVRSLDFGSWFSAEFAGTKIPSLNEFLTLCRNLSLHPYLELKNAGNYTQAQINSVVDMVKSHGMSGNVTYISFSDTFLTWVKQRDSKARIGYLANSVDQTIIGNATSLKTNENEVFIDCFGSAVTSETISLCMGNGFPLEVWTFDNADAIIGLDPYITGVTSDNLIAGKVLYEDSIEG